MAKAPKKAEKKPKKSGSAMRSLVIWVIAPIFAVVFHKELLLLTVALLPTFAAWFGEMGPLAARRHYAAKTVGPMNLVGAIWPLMALHEIGADWTALGEVASNAVNWIVVLGTSAVGWVIYLAVPPVVGSYYAMSMDGKRKGLKKTQEALLAEWGREVTKAAPEELPYEEEPSDAADGEEADGPEAGGETPAAREGGEPVPPDQPTPAQGGRARVRRVGGG